jgi:nitrous oxidase accessory protein NosD
LQAAVESAGPGDIISVTGTCNENVLVRNEKQRIIIHGGGTATVNGPNSNAPTFDVRGKGILIQGFTITGGSNGVVINRGSNGIVDSSRIAGTGSHGVVVNQLGLGVITNNLISNNPGSGVLVSESSAARIGFNLDTETAASTNIIQSNAFGVVVMNSSSARVVGNKIDHNARDGVLVMRRSQADISTNVIFTNGGDGVLVAENSQVNLGEEAGNTIYEFPNSSSANNSGFGVRCVSGGVVSGRQGTLAGSSGPASFDGSCANDLSP